MQLFFKDQRPRATIDGLHGCVKCGTYAMLQAGDLLRCPRCKKKASMRPTKNASTDLRQPRKTITAANTDMPLFPKEFVDEQSDDSGF